jgi:hypothetical protein
MAGKRTSASTWGKVVNLTAANIPLHCIDTPVWASLFLERLLQISSDQSVPYHSLLHTVF